MPILYTAALVSHGDVHRLVQHVARPNRVLDEILVQFKDAEAHRQASTTFNRHGVQFLHTLRGGHGGGTPRSPIEQTALVAVPLGTSLEHALESLRADPTVAHAEPNQIYYALEVPNDSRFSEQWSLSNTGQAPRRGPVPGLSGADIGWPRAMDLVAAEGGLKKTIVVAVIDSGVDYNHPDLAAVIYNNPNDRAGNGIDDDRNGYVDDVHGYNFVADSPDPMDDLASSHGTHVSGIIGAVARNALGIAGVSTRIQIMPLKVLGADGGRTADIAEAIDYAAANGANIINASLGSDVRSQVIQQAIERGVAAGILFVVAAGNEHADSALLPSFPASAMQPGLLAVAATDRRDRMSEFSNWGRSVVHLGAPGEEILSTTRSSGYNFLSGTSMAAPQVAGAAAALLGLGRALSPSEASLQLIGSVDPIPYLGCRTVSGGRLSLQNLVESALGKDRTPPAAISDLSAFKVGPDFLVLRFTAPGNNGTEGRIRAYEVRSHAGTTWPGFAQAQPRCTTTRPQAAGATELIAISGLEPSTNYWVQVKASDPGGNDSLSNVIGTKTGNLDPVAWSDDFESSTSSWSTESTGTTWSVGTCPVGRTGRCWLDSASGNYTNNSRSALISPVIDLGAATRARLSFDQIFDFEAGYDFGTIDMSRDGGPWRNIYTLTDHNSGWSHVNLELSNAVLTKMRLRFTVTSSAAQTGDGWAIDNARITYLDEAALPDRVLDEPFDNAQHWTMNGGWSIAGGVLTDSVASSYANYSLASASLSAALDFTTVERAQLRFDLAHAFENDDDFLIVEASTDGILWDELNRYTGPESGSVASHAESLNLDTYAGSPALWLRFVLASDSDVSADGATIDNLRIDAKRVNRCGDGRLGDDEQCDLGSANGTPATCCNSTCQLVASQVPCRAAQGTCDVAENCNGTDAECPPDQFAPPSQSCRVPNGACDLEEYCTGTGSACPTDEHALAGTVCRIAQGACDVPELCDGLLPSCPSDGLLVKGTTCRALQGACDIAEACDGETIACPPDTWLGTGSICRDTAGTCDIAETCGGNSPDCPEDNVALAGTSCRTTTGPCDLEETCDGVRAACPIDRYLPAGTSCRTAECQDGVERLASHCNDSGHCPDEVTRACAPFLCAADSCANHCTTKQDCAAGMRCSLGACVPAEKLGTRCTDSDQCASAQCIDGVCCDTACEGACMACNATDRVGICSAVTGPSRGNRSCPSGCMSGTCMASGAGGTTTSIAAGNSSGGARAADPNAAAGTSQFSGTTPGFVAAGNVAATQSVSGGHATVDPTQPPVVGGTKPPAAVGGTTTQPQSVAPKDEDDDESCQCRFVSNAPTSNLGWWAFLSVLAMRRRERRCRRVDDRTR